MQIRKYKQIFSKLLLILFLSCNNSKDTNNIEDDNHEVMSLATTETISADLSRSNGTNYLDFEIDGIKYTLIEIKVYDGESDNETNSIYNFYATDAKTWSEHNDMRHDDKAIFDIRFQVWPEILFMNFLSYGKGYDSEYHVLEEKMTYENWDRGMPIVGMQK
jgi:hypothetical protein